MNDFVTVIKVAIRQQGSFTGWNVSMPIPVQVLPTFSVLLSCYCHGPAFSIKSCLRFKARGTTISMQTQTVQGSPENLYSLSQQEYISGKKRKELKDEA